ncbi:MAG: AAA family ATPase [Acidobacteriota bacterium]
MRTTLVLRIIIISPDAEVAERLERALEAFGGEVQIQRVVDHYPQRLDLLMTLRAHAPDVIFLSYEDIARATEAVKVLEDQAGGLQIIAINRVCDANLLRETMRVGVREFLTDPFDQHSLVEALRNTQELLQKKPAVYESTEQILAFLPSKAGAGTTTLALNISAALARQQDARVLLTDMDLNSGMLRFLLKLNTSRSVLDALDNSSLMDEAMWPQLVTSFGAMDVLHAGRVNPNLRIEPSQARSLIQFMRRNYRTLVFDLSGNLERYSLEIMQEARQVFLVCTPEIPSLHLAREKLGFLQSLGLDGRVSLLLNRAQKRGLFNTAQVEELVGLKVAGTFSNDYLAVSRATTAGQVITPDSVIGKECVEFASGLSSYKPPAPVQNRKKFLEFFNVGAPSLIQAD